VKIGEHVIARPEAGVGASFNYLDFVRIEAGSFWESNNDRIARVHRGKTGLNNELESELVGLSGWRDLDGQISEGRGIGERGSRGSSRK
jgi:hypothetical protein